MALKDFHFFCVTFRNENTGINEVASTTTIFFPKRRIYETYFETVQ